MAQFSTRGGRGALAPSALLSCEHRLRGCSSAPQNPHSLAADASGVQLSPVALSHRHASHLDSSSRVSSLIRSSPGLLLQVSDNNSLIQKCGHYFCVAGDAASQSLSSLKTCIFTIYLFRLFHRYVVRFPTVYNFQLS